MRGGLYVFHFQTFGAYLGVQFGDVRQLQEIVRRIQLLVVFFQIFDGIGIVFGAFVNVGMLLQAFLGQLVSVGMGLLILFVQYVLADVGYQ